MLTPAQIDDLYTLIYDWSVHCIYARTMMDGNFAHAPNLAREYAMAAKRAYDAIQAKVSECWRDERDADIEAQMQLLSDKWDAER